MNKNLASLLSKIGRVVKFAGVFLHGTPMVNGWTVKNGKKVKNGDCELADLQTVFLYLDSSGTIRQMKCVLFQANMKPAAGEHVIGNEDIKQRRLYDDCDGFTYLNNVVGSNGDERRLPKGAARRKALQYLFVEPQPPEVKPVPSKKTRSELLGYGEHLLRFLNGKTGLLATRRNNWGKLVFELLEQIADRKYTDGKIKGKGVQDLLKAFNSFESHDLWCLDEGDSGEGFGVQFVIVWDGDIPADPQVVTKPKVPVTSTTVEQDQEEAEELAIIEEQKLMIALEREED